MDNVEEHPGEILKKARLEQGMSLEQIADKTKIRVRYLQAIEDGEYDLLPGYFYTRGFIKSYAEALGLDTKSILDQYTFHAQEELEPDRIPPRNQRKGTFRIKAKPSLFTKGVSSLLLVLLIALILVVIYWFISSQAENQTGETLPNSLPFLVEEKEPTTPPLDDERDNVASEEEESAEPGESEEPEIQPALELVDVEGSTSTYQLTGTSSMDIEVRASGDCWLSLRENDADGEVLYEGTLRDGDSWNWPGEEEEAPHLVRLRAGNPSAIQLEVNDQPIPTQNLGRPHNYIIEWSEMDSNNGGT